MAPSRIWRFLLRGAIGCAAETNMVITYKVATELNKGGWAALVSAQDLPAQN